MNGTPKKARLPAWMYGVLGGVSAVIAAWVETVVRWPEFVTFIAIGGLVYLGSIPVEWAFAKLRSRRDQKNT